MTRLDRIFACCAFLTLLSVGTFAGDTTASNDLQAMMQRDSAEMLQKLDLSAEQKTPFESAMQTASDQRQAVFRQYGIGTGRELSMHDKLSLRKSLDSVKDQYTAAAKKILSPDQMTTFTQLQAQFAAQLKQQILSGQ